MTEIISLAVTLVLAVAQLVVELQVRTLPQRFAVECTRHIALVVAWCRAIAGGEVGGVLSCLVLHTVQVHLVVRAITVVAVAYRAFYA